MTATEPDREWSELMIDAMIETANEIPGPNVTITKDSFAHLLERIRLAEAAAPAALDASASMGCACVNLHAGQETVTNSAPMPDLTPSVTTLVRAGLIQKRPGNRYIVTGLEREREMRSHSARNAAAVRWQSERIASKAEQSKAEQSKGHMGQHDNCLVCEPLRRPQIIEGGKGA